MTVQSGEHSCFPVFLLFFCFPVFLFSCFSVFLFFCFPVFLFFCFPVFLFFCFPVFLFSCFSVFLDFDLLTFIQLSKEESRGLTEKKIHEITSFSAFIKQRFFFVLLAAKLLSELVCPSLTQFFSHSRVNVVFFLLSYYNCVVLQTSLIKTSVYPSFFIFVCLTFWIV